MKHYDGQESGKDDALYICGEEFGKACMWLAFPRRWIGSTLPDNWGPGGDGEHFRVELLDSSDGKIYIASMWPHYEPDDHAEYWSKDGFSFDEPFASVQLYMYRHHFCACHRKEAARKHGAVIDNEECEGERFVVRSITAPAFMLGAILYSEMKELAALDCQRLKDSVTEATLASFLG